jgi:N-acetylmuramic acid 6-phosphate etherase
MATNAKLVERGERIVMEVSGVDRAAARAALDAAAGRVRTAIVIASKGCSAADAEALLALHDNLLRPILGSPPPVGDR